MKFSDIISDIIDNYDFPDWFKTPVWEILNEVSFISFTFPENKTPESMKIMGDILLDLRNANEIKRIFILKFKEQLEIQSYTIQFGILINE